MVFSSIVTLVVLALGRVLRVIPTAWVRVVASSVAVTFTWTVLAPTSSGTWWPSLAPSASAIAAPFPSRCSIPALTSVAVALTVILVTAFATLAA